jgi:hypothetical protein
MQGGIVLCRVTNLSILMIIFELFKLQNKCSIKQGGVSHCGLAIYIKKYLKAKEELWKLKYFTMQKYNLQKDPLIETKSFKIS